MLKKTITYTNFAGETETEDFYFNLTRAELLAMKLGAEGGDLGEVLRRIMRSGDGKQIMEEFRRIILGAYGERSVDGKRFVKSEEINQIFLSSGAYDVLFEELMTNTDAAAQFVNGIVPPEVADGSIARQGSSTTEQSLSPSEIARRNSEAQFQGHRQAQQPQPVTVQETPPPAQPQSFAGHTFEQAAAAQPIQGQSAEQFPVQQNLEQTQPWNPNQAQQ